MNGRRLRVSRRVWLAGAFFSLSAFPMLAEAADGSHTDPVASVIFGVGVMFLFSVLGRWSAERLHQPSVLGELMMGILLGNICWFFGLPLMAVLREGPAIYTITSDLLHGASIREAVAASVPNPHYAAQVLAALQGADGVDIMKIAYVLDIFSRFGVIFLLFMVGLESSVDELKRTGRESVRVAVIGVLAPMLLGFLTAGLLVPEASFAANLFVGATLSATSIGITAKVLREMNQLRSREAHIIIGAAMLDDVLGLVVLALVSSMVLNGRVEWLDLLQVIALAILFFGGVLSFGPWVVRRSARFFAFLKPWEAKLVVCFLFLMLLSWLATRVELAAIIGAFAAGMIINEGFFESSEPRADTLKIQQVLFPLEALLAPLFFMLTGIQVKLESFFNGRVILLALGLLFAAVIGKLISGYGAARRDDRLLVGMGMLPRGEVGLVFASIGRALGVMPDALFSAIILMVAVSTLLAPPLLKMRIARTTRRVTRARS